MKRELFTLIIKIVTKHYHHQAKINISIGGYNNKDFLYLLFIQISKQQTRGVPEFGISIIFT